jgi:phosphocarrier protein HPr
VTIRECVVTNEHGLHARPAANFVRLASAFKGRVTVAKKGKEADAKSILSVLGLGIERNDTVTVAADGDGADDLLDSLESVLSAEGA